MTLPLSLFLSAEMSGTGEDISQVHWKQQWLENGTLYFHVSMTESELLAQTTQPTAREPAHVLHEHMHLLHISVMVSYQGWCVNKCGCGDFWNPLFVLWMTVF